MGCRGKGQLVDLECNLYPVSCSTSGNMSSRQPLLLASVRRCTGSDGGGGLQAYLLTVKPDREVTRERVDRKSKSMVDMNNLKATRAVLDQSVDSRLADRLCNNCVRNFKLMNPQSKSHVRAHR